MKKKRRKVMKDNSSDILKTLKEYLFSERKTHNLEFLTYADEQCFIIKDELGIEYRIRVSKEE
jgi:hypothetical protein